jgi:Fe-S oxidoreductase
MEQVVSQAQKISKVFSPYIKDGYKILSLTPSCSFMLKQEWKNFLPLDEVN